MFLLLGPGWLGKILDWDRTRKGGRTYDEYGYDEYCVYSSAGVGINPMYVSYHLPAILKRSDAKESDARINDSRQGHLTELHPNINTLKKVLDSAEELKEKGKRNVGCTRKN